MGDADKKIRNEHMRRETSYTNRQHSKQSPNEALSVLQSDLIAFSFLFLNSYHSMDGVLSRKTFQCTSLCVYLLTSPQQASR